MKTQSKTIRGRVSPMGMGLLGAVASLLLSWSAVAGELTAETLQGTWVYEKIVMEGGREINLNWSMEFLADGSLKNRNSAGEDKGDGTWSLADGTILYEDTRGPQQWRVVSFDGDRLQVDHQGAQMFFSR